MNKKSIFKMLFVAVFFFPAGILAQEEIRLVTYYPSPYGFYTKLNIAPNGGEQIANNNAETLLRIGVDSADNSPVSPGDVNNMVYVPSIVEINSKACWPGNQIPPNNIGLFSRGDVGIAAVTENRNFPAILGYKSCGSPEDGYAISGRGPRGVFGEAIVIGGCGIGVHGSANDIDSCGVVGTNNVQIDTDYSALPESMRDLKIGVYGSGTGDVVQPPAYSIGPQPTGTFVAGIGVVGNGTSVGVMGVVDGQLSERPIGKYAGYFNGDVRVTGTLRVGRVCIPIVESLPLLPLEGEMVFVKNSDGNSGTLCIYSSGGWYVISSVFQQ